MSNRSAKKKDFLQPEPSTEPPITPYQPKKIKPLTCLLSVRYTTGIPTDYRDLKLKRKYYKTLSLSDKHFSIENDKGFLKIYKKMKYIQGLKINSFSSKYDSFFNKMSKFRKVIIDLNLYSHWGSLIMIDREKVHVLRNGPKLRRLNPTTLQINMKNDKRRAFYLPELFASVLKGMTYMNSLKQLSTGIGVEKPKDGFFHSVRNDLWLRKQDDPLISTKISSRLKRLKKIERLRVALQSFPNKIFKNFMGSLGCFSSLKSVDFATSDQTANEFLQQISNFQSLNRITFNEYAEPIEIILLASKVPSLRTITIKTDWKYNPINMSTIESMKGKAPNIQQLHIYAPLNIDDDRDAIFVANFIDAFPQLHSLVLNLEAKGHKNILAPIGNAINRLQMLEEIQLSLLVRAPSVQNSLLLGLDNLKELRKITLILTKTISQGWDKDIKDTHQALKTLLLANKKLEDITIKWDVFTMKCFEHLSLIINGMKRLNILNLEYRPAHQDHGAVHKDILKSIEEHFNKTATKIKNVVIKGICEPVRGKSCDEIMVTMNEAIKSNKDIANFLVSC